MQGLHFKFIETETFGNKSRQVTFFKSLFYLGAYNGLGGSVINNQLCRFRRLRRCGFDSWVGKIPWRRNWQPTPVFLPGKSHGQRSLAMESQRVGHYWACMHIIDYATFQKQGVAKPKKKKQVEKERRLITSGESFLSFFLFFFLHLFRALMLLRVFLPSLAHSSASPG